MRFIHQQPGWPEVHWDAHRLSQPLGSVRQRQGLLVGRLGALGLALRDEASIATLTADVVNTAAIEGELFDPDSVRSSIARHLGLDAGGAPPASREVEGVVEMMLDATQRYTAPLTKDRLHGWHAALFPTGRSGLVRITVGAWRPLEVGAMQVVSGPVGRRRVHFEAPSADRLDDEVARFLAWFECHPGVDSVIAAGIAHLWFITLHPFEDGNGRIARAIADMALTRSDGIPRRYYSMSAQLEAERKDYYDQLELQQRGSLDITTWLAWFLGCLERALARAEGALEVVLHKDAVWRALSARPITERQRRIVQRLCDGFKGHLTTSKYAKMADCSTDTALRDVHELVGYGVLVQNAAGGRSTSYRLASLAELSAS